MPTRIGQLITDGNANQEVSSDSLAELQRTVFLLKDQLGQEPTSTNAFGRVSDLVFFTSAFPDAELKAQHLLQHLVVCSFCFGLVHVTCDSVTVISHPNEPRQLKQLSAILPQLLLNKDCGVAIRHMLGFLPDEIYLQGRQSAIVCSLTSQYLCTLRRMAEAAGFFHLGTLAWVE